MDAGKPWYYSRTAWGSLIAVVAPLLAFLDVELSPAEQAVLAEDIVLLIGALGGFVAFVGRIFTKSQTDRS